MSPFVLTSEAERYVYDTLQNVEYVFENVVSLILSLKQSPERGHYPAELSAQEIKEFKELIFKPYRTIFKTIRSKVLTLMPR